VRYSHEQPTTSTEGDAEAMALYAGRSVDGVTETDDAASIVMRIAAGAPSAAGPLG
jgi:hypothetical protein